MSLNKSYILRRIAAAIIDYTIIYLVVLYLSVSFLDTAYNGEISLDQKFFTLLLGTWFIFTILLEFTIGYTIGNRLMGIKAIPVNTSTKSLSFSQVLRRRLLDPIDLFFFGALGLILIFATRRHQRLGDLWAKTIVVLV